MKKFTWMVMALVAACGDNDDNNNPNIDAGPGVDTLPVDAPDIDAPPSEFTPSMPYSPPLAAMGPDQIQAVIAGPNGSFYLAGFAAQSAAGPKNIFVSKVVPTATAIGPDATFGSLPGTEVLPTMVTPTGGADEIDLAVQSDGKIIVSFTIADETDPMDRDVAVIRLEPDGDLDTTFGVSGLARVDFGARCSAASGCPMNANDIARGVAVDKDNNIYVSAVTYNSTTNTTDFGLGKLTANGTLANNWGDADSGLFRLETPFANVNFDATVRGVIALPGTNEVISGGYVRGTPLAPNGNAAVWYKLNADGELVTGANGWASEAGYYIGAPASRQTEVYNFALNAAGTKITTGGYGNNVGNDRNDFISMQFDVATGELNETWGGTTSGAKIIDTSPNMVNQNCRNVAALPGGKTLMLGSTGAANVAEQDAVLAFIDASGNLDTKYGTGIHRFKFTPADDANDQFWAAAVSGDKVIVAGWRGTNGAAQSATVNDNSFLIYFDLVD